jgi:hypothetical protein
MTVIGTVSINETGVTYSGFGNLTADQKQYIALWAIERLRLTPATIDQRKAVNQASFPGYTPTE